MNIHQPMSTYTSHKSFGLVSVKYIRLVVMIVQIVQNETIGTFILEILHI